MAEPLRDWNQGDPLSHTHLQEAVSALRHLLAVPSAGVGDIKVKQNEWRFTISVGRIVDKGPNNESAPTDARYWVQRCFLKSDAGIDDAITLSDELAGDDTVQGDSGTQNVPTIFTVTNLLELAANTHNLPTGQFIWYFVIIDGQDDPTPHCVMSEGAEEFWIRITGHTQDGTNKRWKYDWQMVKKSTAGYGGWAAVSPAVTGHSSTYDYAYNTVEDVNSSSGLYGNGVNSSNLTGSLDIQPVVTGNLFRAYLVSPATPNASSTPEVWFSSANGIDGGCT